VQIREVGEERSSLELNAKGEATAEEWLSGRLRQTTREGEDEDDTQT
jgi:hypothetical protein